MEKKTIFIFLIISLLFTACNSEPFDPKDDLIFKLIKKNEDLKAFNQNNKIVIIKTNFCKEVNCEEFFIDYLDHFQFHTKEDLFMRGTSDYLSILKFNDKSITFKKNIENNITYSVIKL